MEEVKQQEEVVTPAVQTTPKSYAEVIEEAMSEQYDVSTDAYGEETFSPRGEQEEAADEGSSVAPTGGAEEQVSTEEPATVQITFNLEQDRANGIDVDDPTYKAALAQLATAATNPDAGQEDTDSADSAREAGGSSDIEEDSFAVPNLEVSFEGFEAPRLENGHPLAGLEDAVVKITQDVVRAAVSQVNKQNQEFSEKAQLEHTRRKLETAVTHVQNTWGEGKAKEMMEVMRQYPDMARQTPNRFLNLAANLLQLNPSTPTPAEAQPAESESPAQPAPAPSQPGSDPRRIARQVVSQQTKPAAPAASVVPGKPKQFKDYREAVTDAINRALSDT